MWGRFPPPCRLQAETAVGVFAACPQSVIFLAGPASWPNRKPAKTRLIPRLSVQSGAVHVPIGQTSEMSTAGFICLISGQLYTELSMES